MGFWGEALFQSDRDLDIISDCDGELFAKLHEQEHAVARAAGKKIVSEDEGAETEDSDMVDIDYSIFADLCSDVDKVREYLDGGILDDYLTKKYQEIAKPGASQRFYTQHPDTIFVIAGACAMTLGCKLRPNIRRWLKLALPRAEMHGEAITQMMVALNDGLQTYESGEPYIFDGSLTLFETASVRGNAELEGMLKVAAEEKEAKLKKKAEDEPKTDKEPFGPDRCAGCGVKKVEDGPAFLRCVKCRVTKYCDEECQKQHETVHERACAPPKASKALRKARALKKKT